MPPRRAWSGRPGRRAVATALLLAFIGVPLPVKGGEEDRDLLLEGTVDRARAVPGEQATLVFRLLARADLNAGNYELTADFTAPGFWVEEIPLPAVIESAPADVGGVAYRADVIRRVALFPLRSGRLEISPMSVRVTVLVRKNPRDFGEREFRTVSSAPVFLVVEPLPAGAPPGFTGAAGSFVLRWSAFPETLRVGREAGFEATVSGRGNVRGVSVPRLRTSLPVDELPPSTADSVEVRGERIGGRRMVRYGVVPREPGRILLALDSVFFYDVSRGRYSAAGVPPLAFTVLEADSGESPDTVVIRSGHSPGLQPDGGVVTDSAASTSPPAVRLPWWAVPLLAAGAVAAGLMARKRNRTRVRDTASAQARKAFAAMAAEAGPGSGGGLEDAPRFLGRLERTLVDYTAARTGIERAEWSPVAAAAALARRGAGARTAAELRAVLEEIERLRYSAADVHRGAVPGILRRAEELWKNLERELR